MDKFHYHKFLAIVANEDVKFLIPRDIQYGASWKASGGRSAWFNLARKIDRLKELMEPPVTATLDDLINRLKGGHHAITVADLENLKAVQTAHDVFQKIEADMSGRDGSVLAEIRDLRRYLLLVEAEIVSRLPHTKIEDTSLHALQD
jgi:hypothetical protein